MNSRDRFSAFRGRRSSKLAISISFFALVLFSTVALAFPLALESQGQDQQSASAAPSSSAPLRLGIAGLVHGHVFGFFETYLHSPEIQIVGIAEPDQDLSQRIS